MPKTEIQKRKDYYQRLVAEETARAKNDKSYTDYLTTLSELVELTDSIYNNDGAFTAQQHSDLLGKYNSLIEQGDSYLKEGKVVNRKKIISELGKYIKKDANAIASVNPEKNNNLKNVIADGRRIVVKQDSQAKLMSLGNALSRRYAVKTPKGQVGFFTVSSTPNMNEKWKAVFDKYKAEFSPENQKCLDDFSNNISRQNFLARNSQFGDDYTLENMISGFNLKYKNPTAKALRETNQKEYEALENIRRETLRIVKVQYYNQQLDLEMQSRIDNKNVSMYIIAKALGCGDIIARSEPMVVIKGDKVVKGTFMETVQGCDLARLKENDPLLKATKESFTKSAQFHKQYNNLCIIDYLCGNNDRHCQNIFYVFDEGNPPKCIGIKGIDNDASFPGGDYDLHAASSTHMPNVERIAAIDRNTAEMVMNLDVVTLKTLLRDTKLTEWEFAGVNKRLENLKYAIEFGRIKIVDDWEKGFSYENNKMEQHITGQIAKNLETINKNKDKLSYAKDLKYTDNIELTEEDKRKLSFRTIKSIEGKMRQTDSFYKGSEEFKKMRDKLYAVSGYVKQNEDNLAKMDKNSAEYKNFEKALGEFSKAADEYVAKKKLQPLTSHGNKRLDLAKKMQDRVWEIADNLGIDLDAAAKEEKTIEQEDIQLG